MVDLLSGSGQIIGVNSIRNKVNEIITEGVGGGVEVSDSAPTGPSGGDLWYDTSIAELYVYVDNIGWIQANGGGGGASVSTGTEAPTSPAEGDLWFNENVGSLFVYISGTGWIETNPGGGGGGGARAYVTFDGKNANVNSTRTSYFNVSSITDNGTGNYTVNFTNTVENGIASATIASDQTYAENPYPKESVIAVFEISSTSVQVRTGRGSYSAIDCPVHLIVY